VFRQSSLLKEEKVSKMFSDNGDQYAAEMAKLLAAPETQALFAAARRKTASDTGLGRLSFDKVLSHFITVADWCADNKHVSLAKRLLTLGMSLDKEHSGAKDRHKEAASFLSVANELDRPLKISSLNEAVYCIEKCAEWLDEYTPNKLGAYSEELGKIVSLAKIAQEVAEEEISLTPDSVLIEEEVITGDPEKGSADALYGVLYQMAQYAHKRGHSNIGDKIIDIANDYADTQEMDDTQKKMIQKDSATVDNEEEFMSAAAKVTTKMPLESAHLLDHHDMTTGKTTNSLATWTKEMTGKDLSNSDDQNWLMAFEELDEEEEGMDDDGEEEMSFSEEEMSFGDEDEDEDDEDTLKIEVEEISDDRANIVFVGGGRSLPYELDKDDAMGLAAALCETFGMDTGLFEGDGEGDETVDYDQEDYEGDNVVSISLMEEDEDDEDDEVVELDMEEAGGEGVAGALSAILKEVGASDRLRENLYSYGAKEKEKKKKKPKAKDRGYVVFKATDNDVNDNKNHFPLNSAGQARSALSYANVYKKSPPWYDGSLKSLLKKVADAVKRRSKEKGWGIEVSPASYKPGAAKKKGSLSNYGLRKRAEDEDDERDSIQKAKDKEESLTFDERRERMWNERVSAGKYHQLFQDLDAEIVTLANLGDVFEGRSDKFVTKKNINQIRAAVDKSNGRLWDYFYTILPGHHKTIGTPTWLFYNLMPKELNLTYDHDKRMKGFLEKAIAVIQKNINENVELLEKEEIASLS